MPLSVLSVFICVFKEMKINIARIPPDGMQVYEELDPVCADLNRDDIRFISSLKVDVKLRKTVNVLSADVEVKSMVLSSCSRCLKEEEKDFSKTFNLNYEIKKGDNFIDLSPEIREEIILGYPVKILCKDDCRGLCPKCGKDLNLGKCDCQMKPQLTE